MSCQCPEVHDGREWRPQCEALAAGSLASAEAEGPEPRSWRCPRCGGSIVRVYFELAKVDPDNNDGFVPFDHSGDPVMRARYRCRSATCGWSEWIMWIRSAERPRADGLAGLWRNGAARGNYLEDRQRDESQRHRYREEAMHTHVRCGAVAPGFYCGPPPVYSAANRS